MTKRIKKCHCALLLFFTFLAVFSFSQEKIVPKKPGFLNDIILSRTSDVFEVKILFDPYTSHRQFELSNPNKIVIDLLNIVDIKASRYFDIHDFNIQTIRLGMFQTNIARLVFDLDEKIPIYKIERIPEGLKVLFFVAKTDQVEKSDVQAKEETPRIKKKLEEEKQAKATEVTAKDEKPPSLPASPASGVAPTSIVRAGRWTVLARTALLFSEDAEYRKIFGKWRPYFELKVGADIVRNLYFWGAWSSFGGTGTIPLVDEEAKSFQNILSFGAGFRLRITSRLGARAEVGYSRIGYKVKALGLEVSGSGKGLCAGVAGSYIFFGRGRSKTAFIEVGLDWASASSTTEDGFKLRLGGWILGTGLGVRF